MNLSKHGMPDTPWNRYISAGTKKKGIKKGTSHASPCCPHAKSLFSLLTNLFAQS